MADLQAFVQRVASLHDTLAKSHPALEAGKVYCRCCRRTAQVDSAHCLRHGWPLCCGETMRLGVPTE